MIMRRISLSSCLLALVMFVSGCVIAPPHEGYYDRNHHRYWHENAWHACVDNDVHCR